VDGSRHCSHVPAEHPHHEIRALREEEHGGQHAHDKGETIAHESGLIVKLDSHRLQVGGHCIELVRELVHVLMDRTDLTLDRADRDANVTHLRRARTRDKHDNVKVDIKSSHLIYHIICLCVQIQRRNTSYNLTQVSQPIVYALNVCSWFM